MMNEYEWHVHNISSLQGRVNVILSPADILENDTEGNLNLQHSKTTMNLRKTNTELNK